MKLYETVVLVREYDSATKDVVQMGNIFHSSSMAHVAHDRAVAAIREVYQGSKRTIHAVASEPDAKRVVANADFGEGWYDYDVVEAEEYDELKERNSELEAALRKVRSHVLLATFPVSKGSDEMLVSAARVSDAFEYVDAALNQLPAPSELGECAFGDASQHHSGNAGEDDHTSTEAGRCADARRAPCQTCGGENVVETAPAGAGHPDDLAEYAPCPACSVDKVNN